GKAWKCPPGLRRARRPGRGTLRTLVLPRLHAGRWKLPSGGILPSFRIRLRGNPCRYPRRRSRALSVVGRWRFAELGPEILKSTAPQSGTSVSAACENALGSPSKIED